MQGVVNEIGRSQRGTPKLKIDGKWYPAGRLNIDGIESGSRVEYEVGSFQGQNGPVACLNKVQIIAPASNGYGSPAKVNPAVSDDAEMRFISNCVGQAIAAGTIKEPSQIPAWFSAAKAALKQPTVDREFDDDVGF